MNQGGKIVRRSAGIVAGSAIEDGPAGGTAAARRDALWNAAVVGVTVLAALARLIDLDAQPGLTHEEAAAGFAALGAAATGPAAWFASPFTWLQSALVALLGLSPFSLRLAAALVGIATVPALAFAGNELLGRRPHARWLAVLAALLLATDYWHVFFSRLGTNTVWAPLPLLLAVGFITRALRARRPVDVALAAIFVGVFALAIFDPASAFRAPGADTGAGSAVPPVGSGVIASLAALSTALSVVGTLPSAEALTVGGPAFDPLAGLLFWAGALLAVGRVIGARSAFAGDERRARSAALPEALLLGWVVVIVGTAVAGSPLPDHARLVATAPALALLMAIGVEWIVVTAGHLRARDVGVIAVVALVAGSTLLSGYAYFGRFLASESGRARLLSDRVEIASRIVAFAAQGRVILAPEYYSDESIHLLARDSWSRVGLLGPDNRPVSSGEPIVYVFAAADRQRAELLGKRLGVEARLEEIAGADGKPLLSTARLDTTTAASAPAPVASFFDLIDLISARVEPNDVRPGGEVRVFLTWNSRRQVGDDYTMFLHLRRGPTDLVAQFDARPGIGRSPTFDWRPGVRVFDEIALEVPDDSAPGEQRVYVGLYRAEGAQRLLAFVGGQAVAGGEVEIGRVAISR